MHGLVREHDGGCRELNDHLFTTRSPWTLYQGPGASKVRLIKWPGSARDAQ